MENSAAVGCIGLSLGLNEVSSRVRRLIRRRYLDTALYKHMLIQAVQPEGTRIEDAQSAPQDLLLMDRIVGIRPHCIEDVATMPIVAVHVHGPEHVVLRSDQPAVGNTLKNLAVQACHHAFS